MRHLCQRVLNQYVTLRQNENQTLTVYVKICVHLTIPNNEKSLTIGHKPSLERGKREGKGKIV